MVAAVILAAGASSRLGQPKQQIRFGDETLLERAVRVAYLAGLSPVYLVIAPGREIPRGPASRSSGAIVLSNKDAAEGMASSIRLGVAAAANAAADAVVILACDQPAVTAEHLRELLKGDGETVASAYAGRKGVPAYFPSTSFQELLGLRGDTGARDLLRNSREVPLLHGEVDIDTGDDLERAREIYPQIRV